MANDDSSKMTVMRFSVRDFVAFVYRKGGLNAGSFFTLIDGLGIKTHQSFFKSFKKSQPDATIYSEYTLKTSYLSDDIKIEVHGRADLIAISKNNEVQIIEIKTIANASSSLPSEVDFLHLAQARIYAYMFCRENNLTTSTIQVTVKYILIHNFSIKDFNENISYQDLEKFFVKTCLFYLESGRIKREYEEIRDASIRSLTFPYDTLRSGQKEFMNTVLNGMKKHQPLLVQAPTGTGKTISTLYPVVKGITQKYSDYIFYVTAKSSTQNVAIKTLDDMRAKGLVIKSIQITAKEKICLCKDLYCDMNVCPYAVNYYNQYPKAMEELSNLYSIDSNLLTQIGTKYDVCPFELGLDASLFCEIIICDYNYIFDPKVQLERYFNQDGYHFTILVDEAHNLPDRANEMFSGQFSYKEFKEAFYFVKYYSKQLQDNMEIIREYFKKVSIFLKSTDTEDDLTKDINENGFDSTIPIKEFFKNVSFCASRKAPGDLIKILEKFVIFAKEEIDLILNAEARKALKNLFFSAKFFIRVANEFFGDSYILTVNKEKTDIKISLRCMDSSEQIGNFHQKNHSIVFFSATLSPIEYFEKRFNTKKADTNINKLILPSPFPRENLFVGIVPSVSTKYQNRQGSLQTIVDVIDAAISVKVGNYLVFCPSFEYQNWISTMYEMQYGKKTNIQKIIKQSPSMSDKNRQLFLEEFSQFGNRTLVAFAVLGGVFGEGIDLVGETLSGVIIVGVGLPGKSPERDIMADYYSSVIGNGFDFAYRFPGFNKIQQAAGRVIRSDDDRGFIMLLDERYKTPEYQRLFPDEWKSVELTSKSMIKNSLIEFFGK